MLVIKAVGKISPCQGQLAVSRNMPKPEVIRIIGMANPMANPLTDAGKQPGHNKGHGKIAHSENSVHQRTASCRPSYHCCKPSACTRKKKRDNK